MLNRRRLDLVGKGADPGDQQVVIQGIGQWQVYVKRCGILREKRPEFLRRFLLSDSRRLCDDLVQIGLQVQRPRIQGRGPLAIAHHDLTAIRGSHACRDGLVEFVLGQATGI